MSQDSKKQRAAEAALEYVTAGTVIGVGTGSTVNFFIDGLARMSARIAGAVSSSAASSQRLQSHGIPVLDLNETGELDLYIDGADEATRQLHLIKGGGAALTREKIVAAASRRFVCIADDQKLVERLGRFPLPVEVIPMARSLRGPRADAARRPPRLARGQSSPTTAITSSTCTASTSPTRSVLETRINQLAGVVTCGLFARRPADLLLLGTAHGIQTLTCEH